ncbi:MAG: hypothetical protein ABSD38_16065 [Syntrophorhabdales bacterium]
MSRRRRKKPGAPDAVRQPQPAVRPPSGLSGPPAGPVRSGPAAAEFVPVFERIAGMIRNELGSAGAAGTMACFVYEGAVKQDGSKPADIKTVSLSWKTEFQKELIRKRIREKALREEATAVVIVTDAETQAAPERQANSSKRRRALVISGASQTASATATITYTIEGEAKTVSFGEMQWLTGPSYNFFLEGILPRRRQRDQKAPDA